MATIKELSVKRSDIFYVDPFALKVRPGWNARQADDPENKAHILGLAKSVASVGVKEAMTVYREGGDYWLSDGHCRLAATFYAIEVLKAEIKTVPVKLEDRGADEEDFVFSQVLRNSGKPLTPYEAGTVYKRLLAYGWTVDDIATRSGRSKASIEAALDLQEAPTAVKKLVATGKVSATLATDTLKKEGASAAIKTLHDAVDHATQKGKTRATKADIGEAPKEKGLTATEKLARIREIIDDAMELEPNDDWDGMHAQGLRVDLPIYKELLKLLGL